MKNCIARARAGAAWRACAAAMVSGSAALAQTPPPSAAASAPTSRETPREFLDSLADGAIAPDPNQIYRKRGARREIDLGRGVVASLDELPPSRVDSAVPLPGTASALSRVFALTLRRPGLFGEAGYTHTASARESFGNARWDFSERFSLLADLRDQRSALDDIDARRRDTGLALRWQALPGWSIDGGLHHASLASASGDPAGTAPEGSESFWRLRTQWQPVSVPGLSLGATAERAVSRPASDLGAGRLEFGADYTLQADNPFGARFAGTRLTWREAPRLGLLSEGHALDARAAYRRTLGAEVPDGSSDGAFYTQWRSRSLASDDDSLLVLGWRHSWPLAPRWLLQGHIEQATPLAGPNAVRSFTVGGRLWRGAFPDNTFVTDLELVNSDREDSLYTAVKYTFRLDDHLLAALRLNATRTQPHGSADVGSTGYKASAALGWREPEGKRLSVLGRWTFAGTETDEAASTDRRAHIALVGANYIVDTRNSASARWSRRWERDELHPDYWPRGTTLVLGRWAHDFADSRWSLSTHVARRNDAIDGTAGGYGAEIGYQLSRKAVLAIGYNPKGFNDHELEVDERLRKGFTLRLRFSIDAALSRWFDAPAR
jgi:hypothetical protein